MLELRPNCEQCNIALPANSTEAMICSYECTFCRRCAVDVLSNVCPNCGGGFERRPIRPATAWIENVSLAQHPASTEPVLKPVDRARHAQVVARQAGASPKDR